MQRPTPCRSSKSASRVALRCSLDMLNQRTTLQLREDCGRQMSPQATKHGVVNPLVSSPQQAPALASSGAPVPRPLLGAAAPLLTP